MTDGSTRTEVPLSRNACLAGALAVCSLALFGRALFGNAAFYARDVLHFYWPLRTSAAELIRNFELPQWSLFTQAGLPFLGDIHAGVLYPPHLLYQFISFPRAYAWLLFLHHLAGGVGALIFLQRLGMREVASLGGALVFMLSGYVVGLTNAAPLMAGAAYLPWVLAALSSSRPLHVRAPVLGIVLALQILCGDVQAVLFSVLAGVSLVLWAEDRKQMALTFVAGFALAALITSVQLLPAWHLLRESNRAAVNSRFGEEFSLHPARLLELVAPFPFGGFLRKDPFWASFAVKGPGIWPFALSAYLGAAGACIALLGARKNRRTGLAITLLLLGLLLALGRHGPIRPMLLVAPFRFFRYPEKYLLLASLGMAVLVTESLNQICARAIGLRRLQVIGGAIGVCALTIAAAYLSRSSLEAWAAGWLRSVAPRAQPATAVTTVLKAGSWTVASFALIWVLVAALLRLGSFRRIGGPTLTALIGLDLWLAAQSLIFTAPIELFRARPAIVDKLIRAAPVQPFRYLRYPALARTFDGSSEENYLEFRIWELATLRSNVAGAFGLEEVSGYGGAFSLHRWEALSVALYEQPAKLGAVFNGCLALATVRENTYERDVHFKRISFDSALSLALYENTLCQPRLRTISRVLPATSFEAAVRAIASPSFDVGSEAIVETAVERTFGRGQLENVNIGSRRATATVVAPAGGAFVAFGTPYYPGWHGQVDHAPKAVKIVNASTMGLEVPEGRHRVDFEFTDLGLKPGLALSSAGLALSIAWVFRGRRQRRSSRQ
jgi:hypothetical protein